MTAKQNEKSTLWRSPGGVAFCAFIVVVGLLLVLEHRAHVFRALPFVLLLLCVGMHLFMHRGHGSHGDGKPSGHGTDGNDGR